MCFHSASWWLLGREDRKVICKSRNDLRLFWRGRKYSTQKHLWSSRLPNIHLKLPPTHKSTRRANERTRRWSMLDAGVLLIIQICNHLLAHLLRPFFILLRPFLEPSKDWFITIPCHNLLTRTFQARPAGGEPGALAQRGGDGHQRDVEGDQQHPDREGGNRHQKHEEALHVILVWGRSEYCLKVKRERQLMRI